MISYTAQDHRVRPSSHDLECFHGDASAGHVIQKCSSPGRPLDVGTIKRYGRQVLDALAFLQDKGFVMGKWVGGIMQGLILTLSLSHMQDMFMPATYLWTNHSTSASKPFRILQTRLHNIEKPGLMCK